MRYVIVVDMQKDFVTGALGSEAAQKAAAFIANELPKYRDPNTALIFTQDTHDSNYMNTLEGQRLPVPHCILGTEGWEVIDELDGFGDGFYVPSVAPYCNERGRVFKTTFGSLDLISLLFHLDDCGHPVDEIVVMGVCTGICVISNVMLLKAAFPNAPIKVVSEGCACVSDDTHHNALAAMSLCHIDVID